MLVRERWRPRWICGNVAGVLVLLTGGIVALTAMRTTDAFEQRWTIPWIACAYAGVTLFLCLTMPKRRLSVRQHVAAKYVFPVTLLCLVSGMWFIGARSWPRFQRVIDEVVAGAVGARASFEGDDVVYLEIHGIDRRDKDLGNPMRIPPDWFTWIGRFTNLRELHISSDDVFRSPAARQNLISAVGQLPKLERVAIWGGSGLDQQALEELTTLKLTHVLWFEDCRVEDLSCLRKVDTLQQLYLRGARVTNRHLESVEGHPSLESLQLIETSITDIESVGTLGRLRRLKVFDSPVEDISAVGRLPDLKRLDFSWVPVKDISAVAHLVRLEYLSFHACPVTVIPELRTTELQYLWLTESNVMDVKALFDFEVNGELFVDLTGTLVTRDDTQRLLDLHRDWDIIHGLNNLPVFLSQP